MKAEGRMCRVLLSLKYQPPVNACCGMPKAAAKLPFAVLHPSRNTKRYGRAPFGLKATLSWIADAVNPAFELGRNIPPVMLLLLSTVFSSQPITLAEPCPE